MFGFLMRGVDGEVWISLDIKLSLFIQSYAIKNVHTYHI